ncbi:hypothetical protein C1X15_15210 [Pseudomonas sp. GW123-5D08]|nr:hypothetical protein C1X15_15210 [Pseudomonas sp. GW123-5D08]
MNRHCAQLSQTNDIREILIKGYQSIQAKIYALQIFRIRQRLHDSEYVQIPGAVINDPKRFFLVKDRVQLLRKRRFFVWKRISAQTISSRSMKICNSSCMKLSNASIFASGDALTLLSIILARKIMHSAAAAC